MGTINQLLLNRIDDASPTAGLHYREDGAWRFLPWRDAGQRMAATSAALAKLGVARGDRVAILGNPHPRWIEADFATLSLGAVSVGIYPSLTIEQIAYQINHSGTRVMLVEDDATLTRLAPLRELCPELRYLGTWELPPAPVDMEAFKARAREVQPDDPCALFYTSGTTGNPKGAIVSHGAAHAVCVATREVLPLQRGECSIIFLPLAHSLQRITVYRGLLEDDLSAWFCRRLDEVPETLQQASPSVLASVPRMLEKIKAGIEDTVRKQPPLRQRIFEWALSVGLERSRCIEAGAPVGLALRWQHQLADRLVFRKVRARMGGRLELLICGGAALNPDVARFFHALGIQVLEGWGLTETCAPATVNTRDRFRFGTVGHPLPGVELKLDSDGEVLVRGPGLFSGYWQEPEATRAVFTADGWFRSGDIGVFDDAGFLKIIDRKKEILVTAGGKNIPPVNIERRLEGGIVGHAVVIGDGRPYLVALLAPDPAATVGLSAAELEEAGRKRVAEANAGLAPFEQIKRFCWLPGPLTVEDDLMTPTLKLKRRNISARFAQEIESLYRG